MKRARSAGVVTHGSRVFGYPGGGRLAGVIHMTSQINRGRIVVARGPEENL